MSDRDSLVQQAYKDDFERKLSTKEAYFARGFEIEQQRIAFYDRLILLAAGTLTLSFTAATSFQSRLKTPPILHGGYLTIEAILLAFSIICALAFKLVSLGSLVFANRSLTEDSSIANRRFSSLTARSLQFIWNHELISADDLAQYEKVTRQAKTRTTISTYLAITSLTSFIAAYVFFFLFVYANLFR